MSQKQETDKQKQYLTLAIFGLASLSALFSGLGAGDSSWFSLVFFGLSSFFLFSLGLFFLFAISVEEWLEKYLDPRQDKEQSNQPSQPAKHASA